MTVTAKTQQPESIERLTSADGYGIKPGDTIYTSHHGNNGTYLKVFVVKPDHSGQPAIFNITWHVAYALGMKPKDKSGEWMLHNPVYGMDRGFDVVYNLSSILFRDADLSQFYNDENQSPETNPGYLLNHRWL